MLRITEEPLIKLSNYLVDRGNTVYVEEAAFRTRSDNTRQNFAKIKGKTKPYRDNKLGKVIYSSSPKISLYFTLESSFEAYFMNQVLMTGNRLDS